MDSRISGETPSDPVPTSGVETLARAARRLEALGRLKEALTAWRAVLCVDPNYLPAWEGSARLLRKLRARARTEQAAR